MATLNENIQRIENAKLSIKASIEGKGVTVPADTKIDGYSALIDTIPAGGGSGINLDLTGTGWETEPIFPVDVTRIGTIKEDLDYTRTKFAEWDPSVTNLHTKYAWDTAIIYAPNVDTSQVTDMTACFAECSNLFSIPALDTSKTTDLNHCFSNCSKLTYIPKLDTSNVTYFGSCFSGCSSLTSIPALDTSKAPRMPFFFSGCSSLTSIPAIDTSKTEEITRCFQGCSSLTSIPMLNLSKATDARWIFLDCSSLVQVELAGGMLPECNCTNAFENVTTNGVLKIHTGNGITRESYNPIIAVLPSTWTVEEIAG